MANFIHPQYVLKQVLYAAAERFSREKSIQLQKFLLPDVFERAARSALKAPLQECVVPDRHSVHFFRHIPSSVCDLLVWLKSKEAAGIVSAIVQKKVHCKVAGVTVLVSGDYTLLHDKIKEPPGYRVILELTPHWDARACGHHSYVKDGEEVVRVVPVSNTLTIVHPPKGARTFIKYVNHHAAKDRRLFLQARFA